MRTKLVGGERIDGLRMKGNGGEMTWRRDAPKIGLSAEKEKEKYTKGGQIVAWIKS